MKLLKLIKKFLFIQNFFTFIVSKFPSYLEFTTSKYLALKKAFFITAHDETYGSYLEFGIFTGSSFNFAMKINLEIDKLFKFSNCDFFGFVSFSGFGNVNNQDKHPAFTDEKFAINKNKILKNIKKMSNGQKYQIIEGFFERTLNTKTAEDYGILKARIILIDCDMKEPALFALNFVKNILQIGTIIFFDDYIFYKGSRKKGEFAAFEEFKNQNSHIDFRPAFEYGYGSKAFIVSGIGN